MANQQMYNDICDALNAYAEDRKNHKLHFEISIAWDDDDEFEHEGYYHSANEAIAALIKFKEAGL